MDTAVISLEFLSETNQGQVLCYPHCEHEEFQRRIKELDSLGVKSLKFDGVKSVFNVPVLGKGYVGIVVVAYTEFGKAALKIRRVDADRKEMYHEGEMLERANATNVGPKLYATSENFLLMELIAGKHFPEWIDSLEEKDYFLVKTIVKNVLEQCYRLDEIGLDHGELSRAQKHIIVDEKNVPHLIDFETASINRRVSNVTSVCQYFFLGSQIKKKVIDIVKKFDKKELIDMLRVYKKKQKKENFKKILEIVT